MGRPLRIVFAVPAYWPATAFGGPIGVTRGLAAELAGRGHTVEVVTSGVTDVAGRTYRTRRRRVDEAIVHYAASPLRYRWMAVTPSLPLVLTRLERPDVVHVFGFRDPVGTITAAWARARGVPYVFEPLGMYVPRLRSFRKKQAFDRALGRPLAAGAALVVATSELEREGLVANGVDPGRTAVRPNAFPAPFTGGRDGVLRRRLGLADDDPLVLYVGRIGIGKGVELLAEALAELPGVHGVFLGPDMRDGTLAALERARRRPGVGDRVHVLPAEPGAPPPALYADADVFVLPSATENFGNVAAEAAAAGTPVVVTDRCGIADLVRDRAGLVVAYRADAIRDGVAKLLRDGDLRAAFARGGRALAAEHSWEAVASRQEELYRRALDG